MKHLIYCLFILIMIIAAPRVFAGTASNSDFDPFPQMEQDQKNADDETAAKPEQPNDDVWPPVNNDAQTNSEGQYD